MPSVQPTWCLDLSLQQQSVLLLAARGPDGIAKSHPCKAIQRAYRGTVLVAAKFGRPLYWGEKADSFMSLDEIASWERWQYLVEDYLRFVDSLPHHFIMHLLHGAEILGYKHVAEPGQPEGVMRQRWLYFYHQGCRDLHLAFETEAQMDDRLNDWGQKDWKQ